MIVNKLIQETEFGINSAQPAHYKHQLTPLSNLRPCGAKNERTKKKKMMHRNAEADLKKTMLD